MGVGRDRKRSTARTLTRAHRVCSIAAPLLIVTTSLDEAPVAGQLFGLVPDATVLGVFGHADPPESVIDLRETGAGPAGKSVVAISLGRVPGERTRTAEIAALIGDAIDRTGASTVAIGLGLRGGDHLEASDAALLARRRARTRIGWIVYLDADSDADAGRIARRRMQLFVRGIRLEPVALPDAPLGSNARYWEIRASNRY
jgi:hypothetical protein